MFVKTTSSTYLLVFAFSAVTMLLEILLVKTCNVIIDGTAGFFLLAMALFFLSFSGALLNYLVQLKKFQPQNIFSFSAIAFCLLASLNLPILRLSPFFFDFDIQSSYLATTAIVLLVSLPFLFSGLCVLILLTEGDRTEFQKLYFFDLLGVVFVVALPRLLISFLGPDGLMASALILFIILLIFFKLKQINRLTKFYLFTLLALNFLVLFSVNPTALVKPYISKYMPQNLPAHQVELSAWDPISRIDVVDFTKQSREPGIFRNSVSTKYVFYDGGTIGTNIYPYDGDSKYILDHYRQDPKKYFLRLSTVASHLLKKDSKYSAYLFGVGAGQEVKAALVFGAQRIYANELVQTMIDLDKNQYAFYNGNIFNSEKVHIVVGDSRLQLKKLDEKFDIIQIFSNYLSSNMAAGLTNFQATYLFTEESMREYLGHLAADGILQINQFKHERILDLIAKAWLAEGHSLPELKEHILVVGTDKASDIFTTILFKSTPFTKNEELLIKELLTTGNYAKYEILESPFLTTPTYLTSLTTSQLINHHQPVTDDRPYFSEDGDLFLHFYGLNKLAYVTLFISALLLAGFFTFRLKSAAHHLLRDSNSVAYFVSGITFILMQVGLIQMVLKYLNWPDMAFPLTVGGICSGIGLFNLSLLKWPLLMTKKMILIGLILFLILIPLLPYLFEFISRFSNVTACILFFMAFTFIGFFGTNIFSFSLFIKRDHQKTDFLPQAWMLQGLGVLTGSLIMHILFLQWGLQSVLAISVLLSLVTVFFIKRTASTGE